MQIAIKDIKLSPYQVRDIESDPDVAALSESIKEHGQLVPIRVRPKDGGYECIFGHRRLRAAELAGWSEVEATVADVDDQEAQIQALIENTQRKDLEAMELARALKALKDATGWNKAEMARHVGMNEIVLARMLALTEEPADVQDLVQFDKSHAGPQSSVGKVTPKHVSETRPILPEVGNRADILRKAAKEALTVDQTRKMAERYRDAETPEQKAQVLKVPAKKQEALDIIHEDLKKAEERAERLRPPMTPTDYWSRAVAAEQQIGKLLTAGRQVEIWDSNMWPTIEATYERIGKAIEKFLQEVGDGQE